MKKVIIFAGANGSGKTTLASTIVEPSMSFINADEIKRREKITSIEAGKQALCSIDKNIEERISFAFETTMSGLLLLRRFKQLKKRRYSITVYYLFAYPVALLDERIKERLKKGGHRVEYADIIRRYYRSAKNFWNVYKKFADVWVIVLNNEYQYKNIVVGNKNKFDIIDEREFYKFKEVVNHA